MKDPNTVSHKIQRKSNAVTKNGPSHSKKMYLHAARGLKLRYREILRAEIANTLEAGDRWLRTLPPSGDGGYNSYLYQRSSPIPLRIQLIGD